MKYIITSSLNADNIISTESISPQTFYTQRLFGYKTFYSIEQIPYQDCLILFSEIPLFKIDDKEKDNFPMILQIDDDEQLSEAIKVGDFDGCSVFAFNRSIYLSPFNCKLLFFSDKARVLTRQNCLDSKMSKLVEFFEFKKATPSRYNLGSILLKINKNTLPKAVTTNENQHDRVKGFLYGYFVGKTKNLPYNIARMLTIQKRIYDIVASIISNDGRSNPTFDEELKRLDFEYSKLDPNKRELKESWKDYVTGKGIPIDKLEELLRDLGKEREIKICFCKKKGIKVRKGLAEYTNWDLANYNKDIESYTRSIISKHRASDVNICSDLDIAPDYSSGMLSGTDETSMLFNNVLAKIIWDNIIYSTDELRINRFDVATKVTQIMKVIMENMGKVWSGSEEQLYFHHLRQNIQSFTPFNPSESQNVILQSLAAFILKGEDFEALLNYLESNSITTYQYALALWGVTTGYVRISRGVLSSSLSQTEFGNVYNYAQLLLYKKNYSQTIAQVSLTEEHVQTTEESFTIEQSPATFSLESKVYSIIKANPRRKLSEKDNATIKLALEKTQDRVEFINLISNQMETNKGIFPCLQKELYPDWKSINTKRGSTKKNSTPKEQNLFGNIVSSISGLFGSKASNEVEARSIINDAQASKVLDNCTFLPFDLKKQVVALFKEFQQKYQTGYYYEHSDQYRRNNYDVIDHFVKFCLSSKNKKAIKWSPENSKLMDELKNYLMEIYGN